MSLVHVAPKAPFLVMNPANPELLSTVIPDARQVNVKGHPLWAVPHTLDAVRVLRNLGVGAPSPILARYRWPGRFAPFRAQRETAAFLTLNRRAYVLNDMGTGKTLATLWALDYLRSIGVVQRAIVFAPLSTLETVWGSEILLNFPHLRYGIVHNEDRARRLRVLDQDHDVYICNHHGVRIVADVLKKRPDINLNVIDELSVFRNQGTEMHKAMTKVTEPRERLVWGLTGTPTPNEPTDAWAQCRLITPWTVPKFFKHFKSQTMDQVAAFKWRAKPTAMATVHQAMAPAIRFSREECVDLPPTTFQHRDIPLTPEQDKAYKEMSVRMRMEHEQGIARAVNEADKVMKLVQIAAGAVYESKSGEPMLIPATGRLDECKEIIAASNNKVIIYVPFVASLQYLRDELAKHWATEMVYGETPVSERVRIFTDFQHGSRETLRVLVANPRVMSHGLTLTAADTVIWFAPTVSHETWDQATHRIIRTSQRNNTLVVMLGGTPNERRIYKRLQDRQDMQGLFLDAVVESRN